MYSQNSSNDFHNQAFTYFAYRLPPLSPFSPFILVFPHTPDLFQWHEQHPEHSNIDLTQSTYVQDGPSSDPAILEQPIGTSNNQQIDSSDEDPAIDLLRLELAVTGHLTQQSSSGRPTTTAAQNRDVENASLCSESNSAVTHLPPLHDVGAFHAHARIVEVQAPAMQRGISHCAEVMCTAETGDENGDARANSQNSAVDLEFLSFSPLFSSQHDSGPLSPSWQLELALSSSWYLAAESVMSLSQPIVRGASLVRRPATRRKGVVCPNTPSTPIRKSPYLSQSWTTINSRRTRPSSESGILRAISSPILNSHAYKVRFEEIQTQ